MLPTCHDAPSRYLLLADEEVVALARAGNRRATEHLITRYRHLVESKARSYFLAGADHEDVVQEGMIGLYKAIRDFRDDRLARFRAFAELCVTRQIITAVKTATRQKHSPLNGYISLYYPAIDSDSEGSLLDCIPDERVVDPVDWLIDRRDPRLLQDTVRHALSELESRVLEYYLEGKSYREMSRALCCRTKCIDNALQRVKRKIGFLVPAEDQPP
ncbi:MAG: RNA polymerase sporulation sigma factor SigH [Chthonomonadales bacterium]|nr:RNA polymerase sporulation sigma factor SigH [Chthonomonadales bacterium]